MIHFLILKIIKQQNKQTKGHPMLTKKLFPATFFSLFLALHAIEAYKPVRYEHLITETLAHLEQRKQLLEKKVALLKQHNLNGIIESATAALDHISQRLQEVRKKKRTLETIKNRQDEETALKKEQINNSLADLKQQVREARRVEEFFETQKSGKSKEEQTTFQNFKQKWSDQHEQLERKIKRIQPDTGKDAGSTASIA